MLYALTILKWDLAYTLSETRFSTILTKDVKSPIMKYLKHKAEFDKLQAKILNSLLWEFHDKCKPKKSYRIISD